MKEFLSQEGISCQIKDIHVTGRRFLLREGNSCYRKLISGIERKYRYIRMGNITTSSQEIWTISAAPAGSQEENNTLKVCP